METLLQTIAQNILKLRTKAGLSQLSLSIEADISLKTLHDIERAEGNFEISTLTKIADALGVSLEQLGEGSPISSSDLDSLIDLLCSRSQK